MDPTTPQLTAAAEALQKAGGPSLLMDGDAWGADYRIPAGALAVLLEWLISNSRVEFTAKNQEVTLCVAKRDGMPERLHDNTEVFTASADGLLMCFIEAATWRAGRGTDGN